MLKTQSRLFWLFLSLIHAGFGAACDVAAEQVETDLSTHKIALNADFSGAEVILFGSVVGYEAEERQSTPDVVVVVKSAGQPFNVQQKTRVAGLWINTGKIAFKHVPGFYAAVSTKPVEQIAPTSTLHRLGIGLDALKGQFLLSAAHTTNPNALEYAEAVPRVLGRNDLYVEHAGGVTFVGQHLFRARFAVPSNVPIGTFTAETFLFRNGGLVGRYSTPLKIEKRGIERIIYEMAQDRPLLYGVLAVFAAIAAGLSAAAVFGRK